MYARYTAYSATPPAAYIGKSEFRKSFCEPMIAVMQDNEAKFTAANTPSSVASCEQHVPGVGKSLFTI